MFTCQWSLIERQLKQMGITTALLCWLSWKLIWNLGLKKYHGKWSCFGLLFLICIWNLTVHFMYHLKAAFSKSTSHFFQNLCVSRYNFKQILKPWWHLWQYFFFFWDYNLTGWAMVGTLPVWFCNNLFIYN